MQKIEDLIREIVNEELNKRLTKDTPKAKSNAPSASAKADTSSVSSDLTAETVKQAVIDLGLKTTRDTALGVLKALGIKQIVDLDPSQYPKAMQMIQEAHNA